jgi:hypothetical protein
VFLIQKKLLLFMYALPSRSRPKTAQRSLEQLICSKHRGRILTKACIDLTCQEQAIYCDACEAEDASGHLEYHRAKIRSTEEMAFNLAREIENSLKRQDQSGVDFNDICSRESFYLGEMESSLQLVKQTVNKQIKDINEVLSKGLENIRQEILKSIDKSLKNYQATFKEYKKGIGKLGGEAPLPPAQYRNFTSAISLLTNLKLKPLKECSDTINLIKNYLQKLDEGTSLSKKYNSADEKSFLLKLRELLLRSSKNRPRYEESDELLNKVKKFLKKMEKKVYSQICDFPVSKPDQLTKSSKKLLKYFGTEVNAK